MQPLQRKAELLAIKPQVSSMEPSGSSVSRPGRELRLQERESCSAAGDYAGEGVTKGWISCDRQRTRRERQQIDNLILALDRLQTQTARGPPKLLPAVAIGRQAGVLPRGAQKSGARKGRTKREDQEKGFRRLATSNGLVPHAVAVSRTAWWLWPGDAYFHAGWKPTGL